MKAGEIMYYPKETIAKLKEIDLYTYLENYEPDELVHYGGNIYTTRTHDSLKISNGKWMWWSRGVGGRSAVDFFVKVRNMSFIEAVDTLARITNGSYPAVMCSRKPDEKALVMPKKAPNNDRIIEYLEGRGITDAVINDCIERGIIYQSIPMNNLVFVGCDDNNVPRFAALRGTDCGRYFGEAAGSDKHFSFRLVNEKSDCLHIFEGAIDLLSYASLSELQGIDYKAQSLLSLSGVYMPPKNHQNIHLPVAVADFMNAHKNIKTVWLHLDNDRAGRAAAGALLKVFPPGTEVINKPVPVGKDVNDYLCYLSGLPYKSKEERNESR